MVFEGCFTNGNGPESISKSLKGKSNSINGFLDGSSSYVASEGSNRSFQTYKRRKHGMLNTEFKLAQFEKNSSAAAAAAVGQSKDKMVELVDMGLRNNSSGLVCDPKINCSSVLNGSDNYPYNQPWRSSLEKVCLMLDMDKDGDVGISAHQAGSCVQPTASGHEGQGPAAATSNGTSADLNKLNATKSSRTAFKKLIMSEKFASLCALFYNNFDVQVDKLFDFNAISSKIMKGTYEQKPNLFFSDVQQFWRKLHIVGAEMVSLSRSLSELSSFFFREPVGGIGHVASDDGQDKSPAGGCGLHSTWEQPNSSSRACTCRCCGEESDGKDCLICDACEDLFHVSCIKPAVVEIPHKNWYCVNCIAMGGEFLHENCAVCERRDALERTERNGCSPAPTQEETVDDLEDSSGCVIENGFQVFKGSKKAKCEVCKSMLEAGEIFRVCKHRFCDRNYHVRCLTNRELKSYGPLWYCPCCLCRICLADKDDSKIVLCDACDHGYHMYCLNPPLDEIPQGKWFCRKCDASIRAINEAKKLYASLEEQKQMKKGGKRKRVNASPMKKLKQDGTKVVDSSGGMDMLLTAADTLNIQEKKSALGTES